MGRNARLTARQLAAFAIPEALEAVRIGVRVITDRVHVGTSVRRLLRAIRGGMHPGIRRDPRAAAFRRAAYLAALERHMENRALAVCVNAGRVGALASARRILARALWAELARVGGRVSE